MTDLLGTAEPAPEDWRPEERDLTWGHPAALALMAVPLAILELFGAQALRGTSYTLAFATNETDIGTPDIKSYVLAGAVLSVVFALLPLVLSIRGLRHLVPSDAAWIGPLLRAGLVLSSLALTLRVVSVLILAAQGGDGRSPFSYLTFAS